MDIEQRLTTARANFAQLQQEVKDLEQGLADKQNELTVKRTRLLQCQAVIAELENQRLTAISEQSSLTPNSMTFAGFYQGMPGWCNINRDMMREFHKRGINVRLDPYLTEYRPDPSVTQLEEAFFHSLINRPVDPHALYFNSAITHLLKPNYPSCGSYKIAQTMFESAKGLPEWYRTIANAFSEVWVPSEHCRKLYQDAGVVRPIYVRPPGCELSKFRPVPPMFPKDKFKFLWLGWLTPRKGHDILLKAYFTAFSALDDVELLFKPYFPWGGGQQEFHDSIDTIGKGFSKGLPVIRLVEKILTQEEMPAFYSSGDWLVCTSRGEGYFLPAIEAMACGVPLLYPSALGLDYSHSTNSIGYYIDGMKDATDEMCSLTEMYRGLSFIEPSWESLAEKMRWVYENRIDLSASCIATAQENSWEIRGQEMVDRIQEVYGMFAPAG